MAHYRANALAPSTTKSYSSQIKKYVNFCKMVGTAPVPAHPTTLARYIAYLARTLKYQSVRVYLAAIRYIHLDAGLTNPFQDNFFLTSILKGVRRSLGEHIIQKRLITPDILLGILQTLDLTNSLHASFWSACLLLFFTLRRKSNMFAPSTTAFNPTKHLTRQDVRYLATGDWTGLILVSRWSKTIQFRERTLETPVPALPNHPLCPVTATARAFSLAPSDDPQGPALLYTTNGQTKTLPYTTFLSLLKKSLTTVLGDATEYTAHSFRRGGASWALQQGIPSEVVRLLGDWQSMAYLAYLQVPLVHRCSALMTFSQNLPTTSSFSGFGNS